MLLLRGATVFFAVGSILKCFNTCSSCEEQQALSGFLQDAGCFNTCSSCEEQLGPNSKQLLIRRCFNTCSSCEEQPSHNNAGNSQYLFQYMLLLRGATREISLYKQSGKWFQYMLLLRGATSSSDFLMAPEEFQYMLLLRGATSRIPNIEGKQQVSIHAPLARSNFASGGQPHSE